MQRKIINTKEDCVTCRYSDPLNELKWYCCYRKHFDPHCSKHKGEPRIDTSYEDGTGRGL